MFAGQQDGEHSLLIDAAVLAVMESAAGEQKRGATERRDEQWWSSS